MINKQNIYEYIVGFIIFWISYTILSLAQYQAWLISSLQDGTLFTENDLLFEIYNSYAFIGPSSQLQWYLDEHFIVAVLSSILIAYILVNTIQLRKKMEIENKYKNKITYIQVISVISYLIIIPSITYCNAVEGFALFVINIFYVIQGYLLVQSILILLILAYYIHKLKKSLE